MPLKYGIPRTSSMIEPTSLRPAVSKSVIIRTNI
jgi:hypothetical protein